MYFSTCNHYLYDIYDLNNVVEYNTCFICLEIKDFYNDEYCINLRNEIYIKTCVCNGWIHTSCLDIWYNKNKNCPFCLYRMKKKIDEKVKKILQFTYLSYITVKLVFYFLCLIWFYYNLIFFLAFLIKQTLQFTPHFVVKW